MATRSPKVAITGVQVDVGVTPDEMTGALDQRFDAFDTYVQQLIADAIANSASIFNQLSNKTGVLTPDHVGPISFGGNTYTDVQIAITALFAALGNQGPSAPVIATAPDFSDTTPDEGQLITIVQGTYTGTQPTSRTWRIDIASNGPLSFNVSGPTFTVPSGAGSQAIKIIESAFYGAGGTSVVTNASLVRTVNAPLAIPVNSTTATLTGTPTVGQVLTGGVGSWTNTPTGYVKQFYRGGVAIPGASAANAATTLNYTVVQADAGAQITFGVYATNAASGSAAPYNGVVQSLSSGLTVAGGQAPSWTLNAPDGTPPALPGWVFGIFQVGVPMVADFGAANFNPFPNGYSYQVLRGDQPIAGASNSNVSGFSYTPVSLDQDQELSFTLTALNAVGSATTTTASVTIAAAAGGGGGGGGGAAAYVGSTNGGRKTSDAGVTFTVAVPAASQSGDWATIVVACNSHVNAISDGFVVENTEQSTTLPISHKSHVWKKQLGTEPAFYTITLSAADNAAALCIVHRGPTSVIDSQVTLNSTSNASPVTVTYPSATTNAANQTSLLFVSMNPTLGDTNSFSLPSGYTLRTQVDFTFPPYGNLALFDKIVSAAGATGPVTSVDTTAAVNNGWHAWNIILG